MEMNPLNWTAGPFLTLYTIVSLLAIVLSIRLRNQIKGPSVRMLALNPLELAYLAGGVARMGDALLTSLLTSKAVTWTAGGRYIDIKVNDETSAASVPGVRELSNGALMTQAEFREKLRSLGDRIRNDLMRKGYAPSPEQISSYRGSVALLFAVTLILGIAKAFVGHAREKPIGILITLIGITLISGAMLLTAPRATQAGRWALDRYRARNPRAARAPVESELTLAVALTGVVVLSGTGYDAAYAQAKGGAWTGGGSGGGDGGGGCGGGGCGGGGCGGCGGG